MIATALHIGLDRSRRRLFRDGGVCGGVQAIDDLIVSLERDGPQYRWPTPRDAANSYAELTIKLHG
jgi:hypothetical protein